METEIYYGLIIITGKIAGSRPENSSGRFLLKKLLTKILKYDILKFREIWKTE